SESPVGFEGRPTLERPAVSGNCSIEPAGDRAGTTGRPSEAGGLMRLTSWPASRGPAPMDGRGSLGPFLGEPSGGPRWSCELGGSVAWRILAFAVGSSRGGTGESPVRPGKSEDAAAVRSSSFDAPPIRVRARVWGLSFFFSGAFLPTFSFRGG